MAAKKKPVESPNPFVLTEKTGGLVEIDAPKNVVAAIDAWLPLKEQAKEIEGKLAGYNDVIVPWALAEYSRRQKDSKPGNFKIDGSKDSVTFIVQDRSSGFKPSEQAEFAGKYGKKVADALLEIDYGSFRLNPEVMKDPAKAKKVQDALAGLMTELGESPLLPGHYAAKKNAVETAKELAKTPEELANLILDLKLTKFIRS